MVWLSVGRQRQYTGLRRPLQSLAKRSLTTDIQQKDEPLRILFCGTEAFSITALEALHDYQKSAGSHILSIDVATRKDKLGGRGMKELRSPQMKKAAARLGLRVHQFDTFTGWHLPDFQGSSQPYINLIIAVSFGLLVPPRILNNAKFGGINVHPSMLPDFRGAAPINWTIMQGRTQTGVSVQTLHPSKFDHGIVLAQTPKPGVAIPNPDEITAHELRIMLAPIAAEMLVEVLRNRLYLQPYKEVENQTSTTMAQSLTLAPKIVPSMKILNPFQDSLITVLRKNRAMPKLWADVLCTTKKGEQTKRLILGTSIRAAHEDDLPRHEIQSVIDAIPVGVPFAIVPSHEDINQSQRGICLKLKDQSILAIPELLVGGDRQGPAASAAARARLFGEPSVHGQWAVYQFQHHLYTPEEE